MNLPKELMDVIVEKVSEQFKQNEAKERKRRKDYRLRNTTLLLKNYRKLRVHCDGVMVDMKYFETLTYDPDEFDLHTLMKYKARTAKMLLYFESIFKAHGELCAKQGQAAERRHRVVARFYIEEHQATADELSDYYNIDRSTLFRDINKATEELSVMLWGIDSFDDLD